MKSEVRVEPVRRGDAFEKGDSLSATRAGSCAVVTTLEGAGNSSLRRTR
jgi:hypothetical protein